MFLFLRSIELARANAGLKCRTEIKSKKAKAQAFHRCYRQGTKKIKKSDPCLIHVDIAIAQMAIFCRALASGARGMRFAILWPAQQQQALETPDILLLSLSLQGSVPVAPLVFLKHGSS